MPVGLIRKVLIERARGTDDPKDQFSCLMGPVDMIPGPDGHPVALPYKIVGAFAGGVVAMRIAQPVYFLRQARPNGPGQMREYVLELFGIGRLDGANDFVVGLVEHGPLAVLGACVRRRAQYPTTCMGSPSSWGLTRMEDRVILMEYLSSAIKCVEEGNELLRRQRDRIYFLGQSGRDTALAELVLARLVASQAAKIADREKLEDLLAAVSK